MIKFLGDAVLVMWADGRGCSVQTSRPTSSTPRHSNNGPAWQGEKQFEKCSRRPGPCGVDDPNHSASPIHRKTSHYGGIGGGGSDRSGRAGLGDNQSPPECLVHAALRCAAVLGTGNGHFEIAQVGSPPLLSLLL